MSAGDGHYAARSEPAIEFGPRRDAQLSRYRQTSERSLYYYLVHVDEYVDVLPSALEFAVARLEQAERDADQLPQPLSLASPDGLEQSVQDARAFWIAKRALPVPAAAVSKEQCAWLIKQDAPRALLSGCLLQNISSAATSHLEIAAGLLKLYAYETGSGDVAAHHGNTYRDLMRGLSVYLPEMESIAFTELPEIADASFSYPVLLLALAQYPRSFTPEILGISLFRYACGVSPLLIALADRIKQSGSSMAYVDSQRFDQALDEPAQIALSMVKRSLVLCPETERAQHWTRIRRGFAAASKAALGELERGVRYLQSAQLTPRAKMIEVIQRKAPHAYGYHADVIVGGKSIDQWLNPATLNAGEVLDALAASDLIVPGDSENSPLLSRSLAFRGPMFRVFSPEEIKAIGDWIDSLPHAQAQAASSTAPAASESSAPGAAASSATAAQTRSGTSTDQDEQASAERYAKKPLGELYYHLLNVEQFPDVRPYAQQFAARWIELAGKDLRKGERPLPIEPYDHGALGAWLQAQHRRQVDSYRHNKGEQTMSKEALIQSTVQQAPMILIDGAWVQNAFNSGLCHTRVGAKLFHIYYDEVGNGDIVLNHPNVFRELLAQMNVETPEFGTLEFGRWPGFKPEAFRIPCFWLSISLFPKRFLPETLGLNLAMELSGVGGSYRDAIDALRFYGFDPCFVELHNTIDNVSTGHTAWALEAIKCHMDEMFIRGGLPLVEKHWHRVWTGYRSLTPPPGLVSWFRRIF